MAEERAPLARGQQKAGPRMPQGEQCVMRMQLAGMEVPGYYAKALFVSERPHEQPVSRYKSSATTIA